MQGVAFGTLKENYVSEKVNREFYNSLKSAYERNLSKNESYFKCVGFLSEILEKCSCNVAMLKGAYLCSHYPKGYRTSNDIDVLVCPQNISKVGEKLLESGFNQGYVRNGNFVPASRTDIIKSRMTRGETIPYIKEVNLPEIKYLEVDINFSLDYKNSDTGILEKILDNCCVVSENGLNIMTLKKEDFFIHLCAHLYKEATTLPWIEMKRDMSLYKYCDIYMLISEMSEAEIISVFERAKEFEMEKICAFAIIGTFALFNIESSKSFALELATDAVSSDTDYMNIVTVPSEKKLMIYKTEDISERFFMKNRLNDLKEVDYYGKA